MLSDNRTENFNSIYDLFEIQASCAPENVAVISNESVTYQELKRRIRIIEVKILSVLDIENVKIAAIIMQPSTDFVATMLALLKLGITYIPIDINYPLSYQEKIISDVNASITLTNTDSIQVPNRININRKCDATAIKREKLKKRMNDIAYIINTSGTSGENKSVLIKTGGLINLFNASKEIFHIDSEDVIPLFHSVSFDFSIWEILWTLSNGACLKIVPDIIRRNPSAYANYIHKENITILNITPTYFYQLSRYLIKYNAEEIKLKFVLFGGEKLSSENLKIWFENKLSIKIELYNMYGITEGTIHSTYKKVSSDFAYLSQSNIGVPLPGVSLAIIDDDANAVNLNSIGELCISGESVTAGYLNDDKFNQSYFLYKNLDETGEKIWFRTGDLVSKNDSLEYIYYGRKNGYLKINGFRINLEKIEKTILEDTNINSAVVVTEEVSEVNKKLIVAYVQTEFFDNDDEHKVIKTLKNKLPEHMVPNKIFFVETFPLNVNGKLDLERIKKEARSNYLRSGSETEDVRRHIKRIWKDILIGRKIFFDQNFFDAGGTSLSLLTLLAKITSSFDVNIQLIDLIKNPTIIKQVKLICELKR